MPIHVTHETDSFGRTERQVAKIRYTSTLTFDDVIAAAARGSARNEAEFRETFERISTVIAELLADGQRVKTPIGTFAMGLRRESRALEHSGSRNVVAGNDPQRFSVTPGRLKMVFRADRAVMKRLRKLATIERVSNERRRVPVVQVISPLERDRTTEGRIALVPGDLIRLQGYALALAADDPLQGVFLLPTDGDGPAVRVTVYAHVGPRRLIFKCPEAPRGHYRIAVRTRPTATSVREGVAREVVEVVEG